MFKKIVAINQDGQEKEITINTDYIIFIAEASIPTNIKGLDGEPKLKDGTSISLLNGLVLNTELTIEEVLKCPEKVANTDQ